MKRIYSGKMTSKGQLTIPREIRLQYGLLEGDRLEFILSESSPEYISVIPVRKQSIDDVAGSLASPIRIADLQAEKKQAIDNYVQHKYGREDLN